MDHAKIWRHDRSPTSELTAIASIWGSGAEVSPIAVQTVGGRKVISCGAHLLPDARATWPELALSISEDRARDACGDVWAHAVEGFLSPLASDELRRQIAEVITDLSNRILTEIPCGSISVPVPVAPNPVRVSA